MTQIIALAALALFSCGMIAIGFAASRKSVNLDGFLIGGRKIGPWMSAFAFGTTYFSAVIFIGYAGTLGWTVGIGSVCIGIGNALIGCLLSWKLLAARTRSMTHTLGARTMPEFFEGRYLSRPMKTTAAVVIFVFLLPYAASVYKGLGVLFGAVFPNLGNDIGISASTFCMLIVAILTAIYLALGGYVAIALSDFIQGIIMLVGVVVLAVVLTANGAVGGITQVVPHLRAISPSLVHPFGGAHWNILFVNILLTSFGTFALPQMIQKFYAIRDKAAIRRAGVVSALFAAVIGCGAYYIGSLGHLYLKTLPEGGTDAVVPAILMQALDGQFFGSVLLSVILLLVLSASMSTLSSVVLTSATAVTVDLGKLFRPRMTEKTQMRSIRAVCVLFVALSFLFARANFAIIVSIMSYSWGAVSGTFIGAYIWGLYSKRTTKTGAWAGMCGGFGTLVTLTVIFTLRSPARAEGFYAAFKEASTHAPWFGVFAMLVSLIIVPVVSLFTKQYSEEHKNRVFKSIGGKVNEQ